MIRTITTYAFPLIAFMYGSRLFGSDGMGQIQFSQSYVAYFVILAMLGIEKYGIREVSQVKENSNQLTKLAQELMIINLCSVILSYVLLYASIFFIPKLDSYELLIIINSLTIGLTAIGLNWLYVAKEDYRFITIRNLIVNLLALISLFFFVRSNKDIALFVVIQTLASSGANILNLIHARKYISFKEKCSLDITRHLKPIMIIFIMTLFIEIYTHLDTTMLGFIVGDHATGLYSSAHKLCGMLTAVITAAALVMMPRMSSCAAKGDYDEINDLSYETIHYILMFTIPCAMGMLLMSEDLIMVFSGPDFKDASLTGSILSGRVLLSSLNAFFVLYLFIPIKQEKKSLLSTGIAAVTNFSLNIFLIPVFAENGAAIATVVAEVVELAINLVFFSRVMSIQKAFSAWWKYLFASCAVVFAKLFVSSLILASLFKLAIFIPISIFGYSALLCAMKEPRIITLLNILRKHS